MNELVRRVSWARDSAHDGDALLTREWLVTNGLGGYASGTLSGAVTRRYHGLLIAALPAPHGRVVMLSHLAERLRLSDGVTVALNGDERSEDALELPRWSGPVEFRLEMGLPVWRYELRGLVLEKRIVLPHHQNTVHVSYLLESAQRSVQLELRPSLHVRHHESSVGELLTEPYALTAIGDRYEVSSGDRFPPLRLWMDGANVALIFDGGVIRDVFYRVEASRGYESRGRLWSPGYFRVDLRPGEEATLVASTEDWERISALQPREARAAERERRRRLIGAAMPPARKGIAAELVLAADQFIVTPTGRADDEARAEAAGDEARTVIAGYHWFTDWGRDTMISLEGLTLITGRHREAGYILRTFARHVRDGLIPNLFPEGEREGLYHTADATLWFFHALQRYLNVTNDRLTLRLLLPTLRDIVDHHLRGTRFGIGVDPRDGLLCQGQEGYQLTWMDAKVDDWVVTPRRGKAVEINALWYNALRLLEQWGREEDAEASATPFGECAERARRSFNERFWFPGGGYLYDVVGGEHGDDPACRPNQVLAIALDNPVLDSERWEPVLHTVRKRLLTPVGLRSLAPGHSEYRSKYYGDLRSRDAAYHQGTVWGWLAGPFVDAWLRAYPADVDGARHAIAGFGEHLNEAGLGSISEIFDAESPHTPRGCIAQAWSVAEALRCLVRLDST